MLSKQNRLAKLEQRMQPNLPWHLPAEQWASADLMRIIMPNGGTLSRAELEAVAGGADVLTVLSQREGGRA